MNKGGNFLITPNILKKDYNSLLFLENFSLLFVFYCKNEYLVI